MTLDEAVGEIVGAATDTEQRHPPFFFIVGAGISSPSIPLASGIIDECQQVARDAGSTCTLDSDEPMHVYSSWFKAAYRQRVQRQRYLRKLVENGSVTGSHLRLAHLLEHPVIANLVVTPNFDDYLTRALDLFGIRHVVCDHPLTIERIQLEDKIPQIVHVHGSHLFYDACNLEPEIEDRADTPTINTWLQTVMSARSPIVVGYCGWERDAIMQALRKRLQSRNPLPHTMYWFCYKPTEEAHLPKWLSKHADVRIVTANNDTHSSELRRDIGGLLRQTLGRNPFNDWIPPSQHINSDKLTLDARWVFEALLRELDADEPRVMTDPLGHFADTLESMLPKGDSYYQVIGVVERIREAGRLVQQEGTNGDFIQAAANEKNPVAAGELLLKVTVETLTEVRIAGCLWVAFGVMERLHDEPHTTIALGRHLLGIDKNRLGIEMNMIMANTSTKLGFALLKTGKTDDADSAFDIAISFCVEPIEPSPGDMRKPDFTDSIASAYIGKAFVLFAKKDGLGYKLMLESVLENCGDKMVESKRVILTDLVTRAQESFQRILQMDKDGTSPDPVIDEEE
jgi:hypothetical protein